jgi:DNA polymerase-3 subunit delta
MPSFLDTHRFIIVREPLVTDIREYLQHPGAADADIVLVQPLLKKPSAAQTKALTELTRLCATVEHIDPFEGPPLASWMEQFCKDRGRTLDRAAARELVARMGNDSWTLAVEMEKLCAYAESTITVDAVRLLVPEASVDDPWGLANALASNDKRGALAALWQRMIEGTAEPLLLGSLASAVRTLVTIRDLAERGNPAAAIAKTGGLHPFVVSKNLRGAMAYTAGALPTALRTIAELDRDAKSGNADALDSLFSILLALK